MKHRTLSIGLLIVLVIGAGCTAGGPSQETPTVTEPQESTQTVTKTSTESIDTDLGIPSGNYTWFENISIGNTSTLPDDVAKHTYLIWDNASESRAMRVRVLRNETVVVNRTVEFPPRDALRIEVFQVGTYTLEINPPNESRQEIDAPDTFDCNYRIVEAAVLPNGTLAHQTLTSLVRCETPTDR